MNRSRKSVLRPQLERLGVRELLSASPATILTSSTPQAMHMPTLTAPLPAASATSVKPSVTVLDGTYVDSVVTIQNKTSNLVYFQLQWPGQSWQSYSLKPGETRLYYTKGANLSPTIDYDSSYQPGYQDQKYLLTSKNFVAGGFAELTPSQATDGQQYYFTTNSARTGLSFYRV